MESTSPQESPDTLPFGSAFSNSAPLNSSMHHNPVCYSSYSGSPPLLSPWGSLHGKPCTLEEYLQISVSDSGKYDLIEGKLVARDMPDSNHDDLVNAYKTAIDYENRTGETAFVDASIAIQKGPTSSAPSYRYRVPDLSVGERLSEAKREQLPPTCRDVTWTPKNVPRLIGEFTSYNKVTDFSEKRADYAKAGVSRYLIVDRDKHHAGTERHNPTVHYGRLEGNSYNFTTYRNDSIDKVGSPGPLHQTAEVLLDPQKLNRITEMKKEEVKLKHEREQKKLKEAEEKERREKEERKKAEERERREKEKRKKAEERERREKEERKKAEKRARVEKRKRKSLKDRLRALGEPVSDSSSGCSSPPRKK